MYDGYACCKYYYKKSNNDEDHVFEDAVDECPLGAYQNCSAKDRSAKCQTDPANSKKTNSLRRNWPFHGRDVSAASVAAKAICLCLK